MQVWGRLTDFARVKSFRVEIHTGKLDLAHRLIWGDSESFLAAVERWRYFWRVVSQWFWLQKSFSQVGVHLWFKHDLLRHGSRNMIRHNHLPHRCLDCCHFLTVPIVIALDLALWFYCVVLDWRWLLRALSRVQLFHKGVPPFTIILLTDHVSRETLSPFDDIAAIAIRY